MLNRKFSSDIHKDAKIRYNHSVKRPLPEYDLAPLPPWQTIIRNPANGQELELRSSNECCIVYALSLAYPPIVPYYVINSAFWSMHSWLVNTTALQDGWDVWFMLETDLWNDPIAQEMFHKANLADRVLLFDSPKGRAQTHQLGKKLYTTVLPYFKNYKRVLLPDSDLFASIVDSNNRIDMNLFKLFGKDEGEMLTDSYHIRKVRKRPRAWDYSWKKYLNVSEAEAEAIYQEMIKDYLGYNTPRLYGVTGMLYTFCPQKLNDVFKHNVNLLTPDMCDDEDQYQLYLMKTGRKPDQLRRLRDRKVPLCTIRDQYLAGHDQYLDHIDVNLHPSLDPNSTWEREAETREVQPLSDYDHSEIADIWRNNIGLHRRVQ